MSQFYNREEERDKDYERIKGMMQKTKQPFNIMQYWDYFTEHYPDYDPDNIEAAVHEIQAAYEKEQNQQHAAEAQALSERDARHKANREKIRAYPNMSSQRLLPDPFSWIHIAGKDFAISKYPITRKQFTMFVECGGYNQQQWWTDAGWDAAQKGWGFDRGEWFATSRSTAWQAPFAYPPPYSRKPGNVTYPGNHPIIGVSWHEAVAFTLWLSDMTGETITLPGSAQWKYAAKGNDGRQFPWGNQWDETRCNTGNLHALPPSKRSELSGLDNPAYNSLTLVTAYEGKGDSPFGVVDMAGNAREWTATDGEYRSDDILTNRDKSIVMSGRAVNIIRGRSITDTYGCESGYAIDVRTRHSDIGFRIIRRK